MKGFKLFVGLSLVILLIIAVFWCGQTDEEPQEKPAD